ncbi:MAG TPA: response regulator [Pyrinomonadaceae bacterium]|nr:response regulator [Pyrinomonadaceae bacterium]
MLAGRKLLLADDSFTIQKVVTLTFADEGVEVLTVNDGQEAIEKLHQSTPDVVLADAVMPGVNGYAVCEYIKQDPKLRHIPVMLLVGSFEPFDEAEARRVGADDYVTKPFQSIRRLIDRVGGLVGGKRVNDEGPTAELPTAQLPHVNEERSEPEKLTTEELEITTADTQPLPAVEKLPEIAAAQAVVAQQIAPGEDNRLRENQTMDDVSRRWERDRSLDTSEALLDLGDVGRSADVVSDDFVLDIDLAEFEPADNVETSSSPRSFVEPQVSEPSPVGWGMKVGEPAFSGSGVDTADLTENQFAETQEWPRPQPEAPVTFAHEAPVTSTHEAPVEVEVEESRLERVVDEPEGSQPAVVPSGQIGVDQLSPEAIDAIARRAVEMLSEKAVQEIAWEVVPQLAELLIKRKLEEKESQPN